MKPLIRTLKILLCLLFFSFIAAASDYDLAKIMTGLTARQKIVLYQYGTLQSYGSIAAADIFWAKHRYEVSQVTKEQADTLAAELLNNTKLVYAAKKPSRLQAIQGVFTASRLLMGMAGLIAVYSLLRLLKRFWRRIYDWAIKYFSPIFRVLFSPRMLIYELLMVAAAAIYFGPGLQDLMLRTIVLHLGLAILWTQLTAITTRRYFHDLYYSALSDNFEGFTSKQTFVQLTMPASITTVAMAWVIYRCNDPWYIYEITALAIITLYSFFPVWKLLPSLGWLFLPFRDNSWQNNKILGAYIVLTILVMAGLINFPNVPVQSLITVALFESLLLLCFSIDDFFSGHNGIKNYIWVQVITIAYFLYLCTGGSAAGYPNALLDWPGWNVFLYPHQVLGNSFTAWMGLGTPENPGNPWHVSPDLGNSPDHQAAPAMVSDVYLVHPLIVK